MGRAEDLFKKLCDEGEQAIDVLIEERQSEELFLDFKRSSDNGAGSRLNQADRNNLSKAISGFGNSEGGVIVWGVDCRPHPQRGDVATTKTPLENPRRFLSWIEGAVSGCTIPAHPNIQNRSIHIPETDTGYVITYIGKSPLAPHQCTSPIQYYMRAGSDFLPVPHAVLSGMFGKRPLPFVFHNTAYGPAEVRPWHSRQAVFFTIDFLLHSHGPGIAQDLFMNFVFSSPGDENACGISANADRTEWYLRSNFGVMFHVLSQNHVRLAPFAPSTVVRLEFYFAPPFEKAFRYIFSYGHAGGPTRQLDLELNRDELTSLCNAFITEFEARRMTREMAHQIVNEIMMIEKHAEMGTGTGFDPVHS